MSTMDEATASTDRLGSVSPPCTIIMHFVRIYHVVLLWPTCYRRPYHRLVTRRLLDTAGQQVSYP